MKAGTGVGEPLLTVSGLTKVYKPTPAWMRLLARTGVRDEIMALDSVDLTVRSGEICAVIGPNGAGKTTLFRTIVGLTTPTSGVAHVLGYNVDGESTQVRRVLGWMPADDRSLLMRATCKENLYLHGRLQGMRPKDVSRRITDVLEVVGITEKRDNIVATLSAGMKARLQLARALLPEPRVLLLDEPTGAIDPVAAHGLLRVITDLTEQNGLAVLISSHRLEEIEALQSNAVLLDRGRVRYAGDLDELRREWERPLEEFVFSSETFAVRAAAHLVAAGVDTTVDGLTVRCRLPRDLVLGELMVEHLGSLLTEVRRVREIPLPLRDLIARVYAPTVAATGGSR